MPDLEDSLVDYIPRLRRYACALHRGDAGAADDLVQDCLERALSRLARWRRGSDLRAWLFTIMHNIYVNQVRHHHAGPAFVAIEEGQEFGATSANSEQNVALHELHHAIGLLADEQREVLLLVVLEGMKYREIAAVLNIPEGTVMSRLSRAREALRSRLQHQPTTNLRRVK